MKDRLALSFVLGTRPEIVKLAPVIRAARSRSLPARIIHSGQHYTPSMDEIFFRELQLPAPHVNCGVGSGSQAWQTGRIMIELEKDFARTSPACVIVQGDTNTVLAGALAAVKLGIPVAHVEAGLRSHDKQMPEEINRRLTDHVSDFLFCPTEFARQAAVQEGLPEDRTYVVGNTIVDAVHSVLNFAENDQHLLKRHDLEKGDYFLLTLHRPENVDDPARFKTLIDTLNEVARAHETTIVFPVHPRTAKRLDEYGLNFDGRVLQIDPIGFKDCIYLESRARLVLTDSGGIQEEACILGKPCVTLRNNTERPETVHCGANVVAGIEKAGVLKAVDEMLHRPLGWKCPFGDGHTGERIIDLLSGAMPKTQ